MPCKCTYRKRRGPTGLSKKTRLAPALVPKFRATADQNTVDVIGACGGNFLLAKVAAGGSAPKLKAILNTGSCPFTLVSFNSRGLIISGSEHTLNPGENLALYQAPAGTVTMTFRCSPGGGTCRLRTTPC